MGEGDEGSTKLKTNVISDGQMQNGSAHDCAFVNFKRQFLTN